jgi:uncharacterized protein YggE
MVATTRFCLLLTLAMFAISAGLGNNNADGQLAWGNTSGGGQSGNVSGTGAVKIEKQPTVMRMKIDLIAKAGSIKEALKSLEDRKNTARKQLEELGADTESIKFGAASVSSEQSEQQQQMLMMMEMINERRGRSARETDSKTAVPITVTCSLTADWKLTAQTPGKLLEFVHPLQQEIRNADISGAKDATALTPEQQELIEEMGSEFRSNRYSSSSEPQPGTPMFAFAAPISEDEQDQALAEAFQKAKANAFRLSKAAGMSLGKLVSVSSNESRGSGFDEYSDYYGGGYYGSRMGRMQALLEADDSSREAIGVEPGIVQATVTVTAQFEFQRSDH